MITPTDYIITSKSAEAQGHTTYVNGQPLGKGYVPRDYSLYPQEMFDPPSDLPLIDQATWSERIKDKIAAGAQISQIRNFDALDQNGQGFCWYYSTTSVVMLLRALSHQPYVRLSAHAGACMIKNFRDEGGWCGLSAQRQKSHGTPSVQFWPEKSMSRQYDKPETWANAALHKVTEDWIDLTRQVYDQNLTFNQFATCLLSNLPCASDFNWWRHSVAAMDLVDGVASFNAGMLRDLESGKLFTLEQFDDEFYTEVTGGFAPRILNSWSNQWGDRGTSVLAGRKGVPDGALCLRVTGASNL